MVRKFTGIDRLIEEVLKKLGCIHSAYIVGDYARGKDSGIIDLVIVGEVDENYLRKLVEKVESMTRRKIRCLILGEQELERFREALKLDEAITLWEEED
ncbi:MAG: hypothetical protein ACUVTO_09750 [Candidatus Caldatribacteriaceae bacterium]